MTDITPTLEEDVRTIREFFDGLLMVLAISGCIVAISLVAMSLKWLGDSL